MATPTRTIAMVVMVFVSVLTGCNSVGPYDISVFRLDESTYRVNLGTWTDSERDWPKGSEELKLKSEKEVLVALHRLGLDVEACAFRSFIPYQSGHMVVALIAGKKESVKHWVSLSDEEFRQWLRDRPMERELIRSRGEFPVQAK